MVVWSLDDRYVITAFTNATIKVWEASTGKLIHDLDLHTREVSAEKINRAKMMFTFPSRF